LNKSRAAFNVAEQTLDTNDGYYFFRVFCFWFRQGLDSFNSGISPRKSYHRKFSLRAAASFCEARFEKFFQREREGEREREYSVVELKKKSSNL